MLVPGSCDDVERYLLVPELPSPAGHQVGNTEVNVPGKSIPLRDLTWPGTGAVIGDRGTVRIS